MQHPDPIRFKQQVGERIRTVRTATGYKTRADLTRHFPDWSESRLANYENGTSLAGPVDILRIAEQTGTNPCWIQFGRGAMYSREPDIQQIRRQNLARLCAGLDEPARRALAQNLKLKPRAFDRLLDDATANITKSLCRRLENALELEKGAMDRQQVDPTQPGIDISPAQAELLALFDTLSSAAQQALVNLARNLRDV